MRPASGTAGRPGRRAAAAWPSGARCARPDRRPPTSPSPCSSAAELWGAVGVRASHGRLRRGRRPARPDASPTTSGPRCAPPSSTPSSSQAHLGTAEALAAALEAKDAYTADHAALDRRPGRRGRPRARPGRRRPARPALRRDLPRHRQDRDPGRDPQQARPADAGRVRGHQAATRSSASRSWRRCRSSTRCAASSATTTSAGTARGYPDGLRGAPDPDRRPHRAGRRRLPRDGLGPAVPPGHDARPRPARSCAATPARSSTRA